MKKSELVKEITCRIVDRDVSLSDAERFLDSLIECIGDRLSDGSDVRISGLGTFSVRARNARKGRNPATGGSVDIPAKNYVHFKPSVVLKERVS
jgi:nucleoid DNA-binding protein